MTILILLLRKADDRGSRQLFYYYQQHHYAHLFDRNMRNDMYGSVAGDDRIQFSNNNVNKTTSKRQECLKNWAPKHFARKMGRYIYCAQKKHFYLNKLKHKRVFDEVGHKCQ